MFTAPDVAARRRLHPTLLRLTTIALLVAAAGAAALSLLAATAAARPKPPPPNIPLERISLWAPSDVGEGLAYKALLHRLRFNTADNRNVTVFRYRYPNGREGTFAIENLPQRTHSERRMAELLREAGIDPDSVTDLYTELEPCDLPGRHCRRLLGREFRRLNRVYYSLDYPYQRGAPEALREQFKQQRGQSVRVLNGANQNLQRGYDQGQRIMNPTGRPVGDGALPRAFADPRRLGGIDFTSLELRYVADGGKGARRGLRYAMQARPGPAAADPAAALQAAQQASDAFFVWLALPPDAFWVNLHPYQPERIIDPRLAGTEAGRVLLESNMLLKRALAAAQHPDTPTGANWWREVARLYGDRYVTGCPGVTHRFWISPAPATVHATADELYILDAPLVVNAVIEPSLPQRPECPPNPPELDAAWIELYRKLIVPVAQHAVNTAPAFEPLRRVYLSRVAAEWFRQRSAVGRTSVSRIVNSGDVRRWPLRAPWNPLDVFNQMVHSFYNGEWTKDQTVELDGKTYTRPLIAGGVDFTRTALQRVSPRDFKARWPQLARQARRAVRQRAVTPQNGAVLLGADNLAR
jgi:hypothetical protein